MLYGKTDFGKNNKNSNSLLLLFSPNQTSELQNLAPNYIHLMYKSLHGLD